MRSEGEIAVYVDGCLRLREPASISGARRDRMVRLDATADSGYSNWEQFEDGTIIVADYTNDEFRDANWASAAQPRIKAYIISEEELT